MGWEHRSSPSYLPAQLHHLLRFHPPSNNFLQECSGGNWPSSFRLRFPGRKFGEGDTSNWGAESSLLAEVEGYGKHWSSLGKHSLCKHGILDARQTCPLRRSSRGLSRGGSANMSMLEPSLMPRHQGMWGLGWMVCNGWEGQRCNRVVPFRSTKHQVDAYEAFALMSAIGILRLHL